MNKKNIIKDILFILLSSFLFYFSLPNIFNEKGYSFLAYIFALPLFYVLEGKKSSLRLLIGIFWGILSYSLIVNWLLNLSIKGGLIYVLLLSTQIVIFALTFRKLETVEKSFIIGFFWVGSEFLREILMGGYAWTIGYSQAFNLNVIQIADIFGCYGVSFFIILVNCFLYLFIRSKVKKASLISLILILTVVNLYSFTIKPLDSNMLKVSVIQGNIPQDNKWDEIFEKEIEDIYSSLTEKVPPLTDLIVWPETSLPGDYSNSAHIRRFVWDISQQTKADILFGSLVQENKKFYNRAIAVTKNKKEYQYYDKKKIIPFFEYAPFNNDKLYVLHKQNEPDILLSRGNTDGLFDISVKNNYYKYGIVICLEDLFPGLVREYKNKKASFLVNMTNDALLEKKEASFIHLEASIFRAVENRMPVIRSANTGVSCIINSQGKIISIVNNQGSSINIRGIASNEVDITYRKSFYSSFGYLFAHFCIIFMIASLIKGIYNKNMYKRKKQIICLILLGFIFTTNVNAATDPRRQKAQQGAGAQGNGKTQKMMYVDINRIIPKDKAPSSREVFAKEPVGSLTPKSATTQKPKSVPANVKKAFSQTSTTWPQLSQDQKVLLVEDALKTYKNKGAKITGSSKKYAQMIDKMSEQNSSMLKTPLMNIVKIVAILEYDFDDGTNKDILGEKIMGKEGWKKNKQRLAK